MGRRGLHRLVALGFALTWSLDAVVSWHLPIWSPRDEIAHYDFIDRLTDGERPNPLQRISPYTFERTTRNFSWLEPPGFDGTLRSMGVAGRSYEAHQSPLYYALLSIPNRWLRGHLSPAAHLRVLRLISLGFALAGALAVLAAGRRFGSALPGLEPVTWLVAALLSSAPIGVHATLGNDALSALWGGLAFYAIVATLANRGIGAPLALVGTVVLALLTKLTSAPLLLLIPFAAGRLPQDRRWPWTAVAAMLAVLALALGPCSATWGTPRQSPAVTRDFASWVEPVKSGQEFVMHLLADSVGLARWSPRAGALIALALAVAVVFAAARSSGATGNPKTAQLDLRAWALALTAITLGFAVCLNQTVPGVHWHAFRHYSAVTPFLYFSLFANYWIKPAAAPRPDAT